MIEQFKNVKFGCTLISFLFIFTLILGWKNVFIGFEIALQANSFQGIYLFIMGLSLLFLIFNLVAAIGLFRLKKWGFIFAYIAILYSSIFFSTTYIPFISKIFPVNLKSWVLLAVNLFLILYIIYLDIIPHRKN